MPAALCGVVGFKPTAGRLSNAGYAAANVMLTSSVATSESDEISDTPLLLLLLVQSASA